MTEQEWLASDDPWAMLRHLGRLSARQARHYALACCELSGDAELGRDARALAEAGRYEAPAALAINWAWGWAGNQKKPDQATRAALLREVVGNPFRPVTLPPGPSCVPTDWECKVCGARPDGDGEVAHGKGCYVLWEDGGGTEWVAKEPGPCAWLTPTVLSLAQAACDERRPDDGTLDPLRLAVLADALEEAGCEACPDCKGRGEVTVREFGFNGSEWHDVPCPCRHSRPLAHLRSPGPHVRGCWALDLILGKG